MAMVAALFRGSKVPHDPKPAHVCFQIFNMNKVLVCGAGGFIGGHLVADLRRQGVKNIRAVDIKPFDQWYQRFDDVENFQLDLSLLDACDKAVKGCDWVYNLAADMGGMGFIE